VGEELLLYLYTMSEIIEKYGKKFKRIKTPCTCPCHNPNNIILHIMACCEGGYVNHDIPLEEDNKK